MERVVTLNCVAAIALWALTFVFIISGTVLGLVSPDEDMHPVVMMLMAYGLVCAAGGATVSIRQMFKRQNKLLKAAFELGQDSGPVRRVH